MNQPARNQAWILPLLIIILALAACVRYDGGPVPVSPPGEVPASPGAVLTPTLPATPTTQQVPTPTSEAEAKLSRESGGDGSAKFAEETVVQRPAYDVSRPFQDLVKPHFYATGTGGELVPVQGGPDLILEREGRIKIRLQQGAAESYLDLLALEAELIGEHPVQKIYRLRAMGIPVAEELYQKLQAADFPQQLFHRTELEYQRGKDSSGVIAEVFPDGTLLVILDDVPKEWRSGRESIASPTHVHVNPRALSVKDSTLAQEYEEKILSLPFDDQRYPSPALAQQQCDVYQESLQGEQYRKILSSVGFRFSPDHVIEDPTGGTLSFGAKLSSVIREGAGQGVRYFGMEQDWIADILRQLDAPWIGPCDTAGGVRSYRLQDDDTDRYYLALRRSLEPDKKQRYKIIKLADDGSGQEIYTAPGIMLLALPVPWDENRWIMSTEGWTSAEGDQPADPRWQSVYLVNLQDPEDYRRVGYPISQFPKAPEGGLYWASAALDSDGRYLFNTLYGFKDEGGGLWVADLAEEDFHAKPDKFARIVEWDHMLSWMFLDQQTEEPAPYRSIFVTGKEVADDFAMTANLMRIKETGLESAVEYKERLLQMVGWNPVPFVLQTVSDHQVRVAAETHFSYESSLLPRAKGVYILSIDTDEIK